MTERMKYLLYVQIGALIWIDLGDKRDFYWVEIIYYPATIFAKVLFHFFIFSKS